MLITWNVNPIAISFKSISIHWYGILFSLGFLIGYFFTQRMFKKLNIPLIHLDSLLMYCFLGTIIGARLGHCLFYQPEFYLSNPIEIFKIWQGGLASHGGGIGLILSVLLFCRIKKFNFLPLADLLVIPTAFEGTLIRLGNFFNSEIYGKPTNSDFGVIFNSLHDNIPRHPTQLYESLSYLVITAILIVLYKNFRNLKNGQNLGIFLILIFITRFLLEFLKPEQAEFNLKFLTVGQYLSIPFILLGFGLLLFSKNKTGILNDKTKTDYLNDK
jgi:prolipoprotein diacylglyceryl transferase